MDAMREQLQSTQTRTIAIGLLIGLILGWLFGAFVAPPRFTDAGPQHLSDFHLQQYVEAFADSYAANNQPARVQQAFCYWSDTDPSAAARELEVRKAAAAPAFVPKYDLIIQVLQQNDCAAYLQTQAAVDGEGGGGLGNLLGILLGALLLLVAGAAALLWLSRRQTQPRRTAPEPVVATPPTTMRGTAGPAPQAPAPAARRSREPEITPLAGFQTTYMRGDDNYDKSFIIENANGDFLGECGVSISESIGANGARSVTAFEIWLFDKTDTHTVTKVIMSDHAFHDDGFRAKLAPRGEPILARDGETIALETASLIINATIADLAYAQDTAIPESGFDQFTTDLAAWVKSDDGAAPAASTPATNSADDMLEF